MTVFDVLLYGINAAQNVLLFSLPNARQFYPSFRELRMGLFNGWLTSVLINY